MRALVEAAAADRQTIEIVGGGSKRGYGRPVRADHRLSLRHLTGIVDYDPSELVLTARAATPMREIEALLGASQQMLAFEPPDWSRLFGGGAPTLGGTVACNLAGPRRVRAGAARDHFLGFAAINGWGEGWRAGGKVVKNVTGYDMCKLQAGAFGTLSVLTEISVRVMPKPETVCTLLIRGSDDAAAVGLMSDALNTEHEVSAAAHIPSLGATALRIEGPAPSVVFRADALKRRFGHAERLGHADSEALWAKIGGVEGLLPIAGRHLWRLCPTPSEAPAIVRRIREVLPSAEAFYDWGGGLVWLSLEATDAAAAMVREALTSGHATLFVAPDLIRETVAVFQPVPAPLDALLKRVKANFDPQGILNPGRMQEGL